MCGITGIFQKAGSQVERPDLDSMTQRLKHRGPDGQGTYTDGPLGLGHRRLAVLDCTDFGHQPMSYASGRYWITYNGEIYNFLEIRAELQGKGYSFFSESDTEVILAAFAEWGEECQLRFNGMWAFALWDSFEKKLFLSRDRFGVKPLYYIWQQGILAFASESKAFQGLSWFKNEIDRESASRLLGGDSTLDSSEKTLFIGVKQIKAGYSLTVTIDSEPKLRQWWNTFEHLQITPLRFEDQVEKFRELLFDACKIRMRSDVTLGTLLSGGLDSSSILSIVHSLGRTSSGDRMAKDWQRAIVACFVGCENDERNFAEQAAKHLGIIPTYFEIDASEVLKTFEESLFSAETINDNINTYWLTYRELKRCGITVSLDGHGADEHLGGYPWHVQSARLDSIGWPYDTTARSAELEETLYAQFPDDKLPEGFTPDTSGWIRNPVPRSQLNEDDNFNLSRYSGLNRHLHYDVHYASLPGHLHRFDHSSMAHGIEVRAPFLDWRLVTYALSLPADAKISGGFTKRILRESIKGLVAEPIRTRRTKIGFGSPIIDWMSGPLRSFVLDTVHSDFFVQSSVSDGSRIAAHVDLCMKTNDFKSLKPVLAHIQAAYLEKIFGRTSRQQG